MASPKVKLQFALKINKDRWKIRLYTKENFNKMWPDAVGITQYDHRKKDRVISFKGPRVCRDTIAHELQHAYLSYYDFSRTSYGAIEEKICEITGKKYKVLYKLTNKIYNAFRRRSKRNINR